jgi:hypothetical protein
VCWCLGQAEAVRMLTMNSATTALMTSYNTKGQASAERILTTNSVTALMTSHNTKGRQGVLVLGSGEAVHNVPLMGARNSPRQPWCTAFEGWLEETLLRTPGADDAARDEALAKWKVRCQACRCGTVGSIALLAVVEF